MMYPSIVMFQNKNRKMKKKMSFFGNEKKNRKKKFKKNHKRKWMKSRDYSVCSKNGIFLFIFFVFILQNYFFLFQNSFLFVVFFLILICKHFSHHD